MRLDHNRWRKNISSLPHTTYIGRTKHASKQNWSNPTRQFESIREFTEIDFLWSVTNRLINVKTPISIGNIIDSTMLKTSERMAVLCIRQIISSYGRIVLPYFCDASTWDKLFYNHIRKDYMQILASKRHIAIH